MFRICGKQQLEIHKPISLWIGSIRKVFLKQISITFHDSTVSVVDTLEILQMFCFIWFVGDHLVVCQQRILKNTCATFTERLQTTLAVQLKSIPHLDWKHCSYSSSIILEGIYQSSIQSASRIYPYFTCIQESKDLLVLKWKHQIPDLTLLCSWRWSYCRSYLLRSTPGPW